MRQGKTKFFRSNEGVGRVQGNWLGAPIQAVIVDLPFSLFSKDCIIEFTQALSASSAEYSQRAA